VAKQRNWEMKNMNKPSSDNSSESHHITRRSFLGTTAASGAALLTGGITSLIRTAASAAKIPDSLFVEATIPQLQGLMAAGQLTSRQLVLGYLSRIAAHNPLLHAVIETNPNAVAIAAGLDNERRAGLIRGPL